MRQLTIYAVVFIAILLLSIHTLSHSEPINPTAVGDPARNAVAPPTPQSYEIQFLKPAFWTRRLINLPTTQTLGRGELLFRISHRYNRAVREGENHLFGLDGPAKILLSLGYGIRDNVSVTLGRTNLNDVVELSCTWRFVEQGKRTGFPFSASMNVGGSLETETEQCEDVFESDNLKFNAQLSLSHQVSDAFSLLLVPAFSSNSNSSKSSSEGTLILGWGGRLTFIDNLSLIWESLPHLSGFEAESQGWGLGLEYKAGGHVFQVFLTNMLGLTSDQFLPGGDIKLNNSDYRLGFNIFRSFWF